jgi:hypothetical protein
MWRPSLMWAALIASVVLIAILGWQNRGLRAQRDWFSGRAMYAYRGMYVPKVFANATD